MKQKPLKISFLQIKMYNLDIFILLCYHTNTLLGDDFK